MAQEINDSPLKINILARNSGREEIKQQALDLDIEKDVERGGIGMGVLSDGTPYLNQRGLSALCGVMNAHIGTISSQWDEPQTKPRIAAIRSILNGAGHNVECPHIAIRHRGKVHFCYPAEVCLAILEYYAFDAGHNCQPEARENFRKLAGSKLREMIYSEVGYDPKGLNRDQFDKWHERLALNYQAAPRNYFHVFNEAHSIIYEMIIAGAPIDERTIVDGSIGSHWGRYWSEQNLEARFGARIKYEHNYPPSHPQSKANPHFSWCYPIEALGEYRRWLQDTYIDGGKYRQYISGKVRKGDLRPSVAELAIASVEAPQIGVRS